MIPRIETPALAIVPAEPGAGKTVVAGAIADWFRRRGGRAGVFVPVQTGAEHRREGLVSAEAEYLAVCAAAPDPLDLICPQRFAEPLIPAVAARRQGNPIDWDSVGRAARLICHEKESMIVQMPGPAMTPLDEKHAVVDLLRAAAAGVVIVVRPGLDAINAALLTQRALRSEGVTMLGTVVNRYPADSPAMEHELALRELEKWSKRPVLCAVPLVEQTGPPPPEAIAGVADLVDWRSLLRR